MRYILIFTIFILGIVTACQQASTQTTNQGKNAKASPTATAPQEEAKRISLKDAKAAYDGGTALIVDTRAIEAYNSEHIKSAISMPAGEVENRIAELPKDKQIIFYCS